jgi:error-prone DNA polymerase
VSIRATGAWELSALQEAWTAGGIAAVRDALDAADRAAWERAAALTGPADALLGVGETPEGRRVLVHASGFKQSPYADIRPAGEEVRGARGTSSLVPTDTVGGPPRKLWHASPGSAGH